MQNNQFFHVRVVASYHNAGGAIEITQAAPDAKTAMQQAGRILTKEFRNVFEFDTEDLNTVKFEFEAQEGHLFPNGKGYGYMVLRIV